MQHSPS